MWVECLGADTGGMAEIERYRNRALHDRTYRTGRHYNEFFMRYCQSIPDRYQINETLAWNRIWRELDRGGVVVFYCRESRHRAPSTAAMFMMRWLGMSWPLASACVNEHGKTDLPNVRNYEKLKRTTPIPAARIAADTDLRGGVPAWTGFPVWTGGWHGGVPVENRGAPVWNGGFPVWGDGRAWTGGPAAQAGAPTAAKGAPAQPTARAAGRSSSSSSRSSSSSSTSERTALGAEP